MLLFSCDPARRMIRQYDLQHDTIALLLYPPDYLYRTNSRNISIDGFDSFTQYQKDSAKYFNSLFVQHLSDSICLSNLVNSFIEELSANRFRVFLPEQFEDFLKCKGPAYILNMVQAEIAEYDYQIWPNYEVEGYGDSYTVNGVSVKNWFEFSERDDTAKMKVLFSRWNFEDKLTVHMGVTQSETFGFVNAVDFLTLEKIYDDFKIASLRNSSLFSDYILNLMLRKQFPGRNKGYYFFYSQGRNIRKYGVKFTEM